ncbi:MAG: potassium channel protein, partial [Deltaproteobacteria bacterium]
MELKKRLYFLVMTSLLVVVAGSCGYFILFGGRYGFLDCLYMTVISLTSVGYGEVLPITGNTAAQVFTMLLITLGLGVILYGISTLAALFIEGEVSGFMRESKMKKKISALSDHYIVCGGGETGYPLIVELVKNGEKVVLIEHDQEKIDKCSSIEGILYIKGDATEDVHLIEAGIERARGILIALPSDKDSLYITMSARMLNKRIRIISR